MARGGRPAKPTALLKLQGTYEPGRHAKRIDATLVVPGELADLEPPPDLTESQEDVWRYAIANMPREVLKNIDREMLLIWVEAADRHNTARLMQAMLDRDTKLKLLVKGPHGLEASPYHDILDKTAKTMIRVAQELGFTPVARARIKVEPRKSQNEDDAEGLDPWKLLEIVPEPPARH